MCEICEWEQCETVEANVLASYRETIERARADVNWPWTDRAKLEEWTPKDGYEEDSTK